jgi:hypothetical protein
MYDTTFFPARQVMATMMAMQHGYYIFWWLALVSTAFLQSFSWIGLSIFSHFWWMGWRKAGGRVGGLAVETHVECCPAVLSLLSPLFLLPCCASGEWQSVATDESFCSVTEGFFFAPGILDLRTWDFHERGKMKTFPFVEGASTTLRVFFSSWLIFKTLYLVEIFLSILISDNEGLGCRGCILVRWNDEAHMIFDGRGRDRFSFWGKSNFLDDSNVVISDEKENCFRRLTVSWRVRNLKERDDGKDERW